MEIYNRQKKLNLHIPKSIAVVGCGGIGSWLALCSSLIGVKKVIVIDYDIIEDSNLNRTPFRLSDVGRLKVKAIEEIIKERRDDCEVIAIARDINTITEKSIYHKEIISAEYIIDCRDVFRETPKWLQGKITAKLGYDGKSITVIINPDYSKIYGDEDTYSVVPSYLVPPVMVSMMFLERICSDQISKKSEIINISVEDLIYQKLKKI